MLNKDTLFTVDVLDKEGREFGGHAAVGVDFETAYATVTRLLSHGGLVSRDDRALTYRYARPEAIGEIVIREHDPQTDVLPEA